MARQQPKPAYQPIQRLSELSRKQITISQIRSEQGEALVLSRFGDHKWDFSPYIHTKNTPTNKKKISFVVKFEDGTCLTDPRHEPLLDSVKAFIYTRWHMKGIQGKYLKASTIVDNFRGLRPLLHWMNTNNFQSFSELTPERCQVFVNYQKSVKSKSGKKLKPQTLLLKISTLESLYALRDHLDDTLPEHPWPDSSATLLAGKNQFNRKHRQRTTEKIPNQLTIRLMQSALDYVENRSENLLNARDHILKMEKQIWKQTEADYQNKAYKISLQVFYNERKKKPINQYLQSQSFPNKQKFEKELVYLRTACSIVCEMLSGMRQSELMSLQIHCYRTTKDEDDIEYGWIKGLTYKLEEDPQEAEWMVSPVVGKAVEVARRLSEPLRVELKDQIQMLEENLSKQLKPTKRLEINQELQTLRSSQNSLFLGVTLHQNNRIGGLSHMGLSRSLKNFVRHINLRVIKEDMPEIDNPDIQVGDLWPLASHQFRKSYAVFVARHMMGDLRYLREHLKHWSIDMTWHYARHDGKVDETLLIDILNEYDELQAVVSAGWFDNKSSLSGGAGKRIMKWRKEVKFATNLKSLARQLGQNYYIRGTGHSWCLGGGSGCGGEGLYDALRCVGCGEGVIDQGYVDIWKGIREQQIEVLQLDDLGDPSWEKHVKHLEGAEKILTDLDVDFKPFEIPPMPSERRRITP